MFELRPDGGDSAQFMVKYDALSSKEDPYSIVSPCRPGYFI